MHLEEKTTDSKPVFSGKVVDLRIDTVELEDGSSATREVISHPGGACVVPLDDNGDIIMVRQFRYPFGTQLIEVPAGKLNYGEDPYETALRELKEETGAVCDRVTDLGVCYPTVAYDTEKIHMYLCEGRKDFLHKKSREITNQYDIVIVEDIDLQAIANSDFGNGKATMDNGFGYFRNFLEYKLSNEGKVFLKVDKWFPSSQMCSSCGIINPEVKDLKVRKWTCPHCGTVHDRDLNAAINIKNEGLRMLREVA